MLQYIIKNSFLGIVVALISTFFPIMLARFLSFGMGFSYPIIEFGWMISFLASFIFLYLLLFYNMLSHTGIKNRFADMIIAFITLPVIYFLKSYSLPIILLFCLYAIVWLFVAITNRGNTKKAESNDLAARSFYVPIKMTKLVYLYFLTFGWYRLYWWYKNWSFIKQRDNNHSWPWFRSIFAIFFYGNFLEDVNKTSKKNNVAEINYASGLYEYYIYLVIIFLAVSFFGVIYFTYVKWIYFPSYIFTTSLSAIYLLLTLILFVVPQRAINRLNQTMSGGISYFKDNLFMHVVFILIGATIWLNVASKIIVFTHSPERTAEIFYSLGRYEDAFAKAYPKAQEGDKNAQLLLGKMYLSGNGTVKDLLEALKWLEKSAQQNNVSAQEYLGTIYRSGKEVTQDYQKSAMWYQRAVDQGSAYAANDLGYLYGHGLGVTKNLDKEQELYEFSASKGDSYAMYNIGDNFEKKGDYKSAAIWYERSIKGNEVTYCASYNLGSFYAKGQGVKHDQKQAQALFRIAAQLLLLQKAEEIFAASGVTTSADNLAPKSKYFDELTAEFMEYQYLKASGAKELQATKIAPQNKKILDVMMDDIAEDCWG